MRLALVVIALCLLTVPSEQCLGPNSARRPAVRMTHLYGRTQTNKQNCTDLSTRATEWCEHPEFMVEEMAKCAADPYNPKINPDGYLNCGTADNTLCVKELHDWILTPGVMEHKDAWFRYSNLAGLPEMKEAVANFVTDFMKPTQKIDPDNMMFTSGVTNGLEALSFTLGDPGDSALMFCPGYARFFTDFGQRAGVKMSCIQLTEENDFEFTVDMLESAIQDLQNQGKHIAAFIHCNPNNPLGKVYPKSLTLGLMKVCAKYGIDFVSDEIYALSVYDESVTFESILSFEDEWPDPMRTYFLWGASKDFAFPGLRFGCVYTQNKAALKVMGGMSLWIGVPPHNQALMRNLVTDRKWLTEHYFPTNLDRMKKAHERLVKFFEGIGARCLDAVAGPFMFVDLVKFLTVRNTTGEMELFYKLFDDKVYVMPGSKFYSADPGWFRVTFAIPPVEMDELERRLVKILGEEDQ